MKKWVVVQYGGTDRERILGEFQTFAQAYDYAQGTDGADVMKRLPDGTLTTEY